MIYRLSIYEIDKRIKNTKLYFEEDCSGFVGSHYKKGKEILESDLKRLYNLGYNILWVNDGKKINTKDKKAQDIDLYLYDKKLEIEPFVGRGTYIIDENQVKKPDSTLKIFDGDDLLKQNINALQKDGAKLVLKGLYGERGKKIQPLKSIINRMMKEGISKFGVFDNISIGNAHIVKKKKDKNKKRDIERTNFYLKSSIITGIAFFIVLNNIMKERNPRFEGILQSKINPRKRPPYKKEKIINSSFSTLFSDMGFLHIILDSQIQKTTKQLFSEDDKIIDDGTALKDDRIENIFDRHPFIIAHILGSDSSDPPLISEEEEDMLKYTHRGLDGSGFPKRNFVTETITKIINEETNETKLEIKTLFDSELKELPRLLGIINTIVNMVLGTAWRLPVERDMVIRYLKMNAIYPTDPISGTSDKEGIWNFEPREIYDKRIDGFLLDKVLECIYLYKIGEAVPLYNIKKPEEIKYHAIVVEYTSQPNRPIVMIKDETEDKKLDLTKEENDKYFIGEYAPSIKLKKVMEEYAPKFSDMGIYLTEDLYVPDDRKMKEEESIKESNKRKQLDKEVDNLFSDDAPDVDELTETASEEDVDALLSQFMPTNQQKTKKEDKNIKKDKPVVEKNIQHLSTGLFDDDENLEDEEIMEDLNYIYIKNHNGINELYGLGIVNDISNYAKEVELTHLSIDVNEKIGLNKKKIVKIHPAHREKITVYNNTKSKDIPIDYIPYSIGKVVDKNTLNENPYIIIKDNYNEGDFYFLYYVSELDPKKNPDYKSVNPNKAKGILTYIVKIIKKTDKPESPLVKFFLIYKREENKGKWKKDNHYGQEIDLRKFPFFRLDRKLSSSELASIIGLK